MCCLFGLMDYGRRMSGRHKSLALYNLASACEVRGTDATGVAYNSGGKLRIYKRPVAAHRMRFHIPGDAAVIMGHTRMTTQGSARRNYNNHPFPGRAGAVDFALAHNGVLYNDVALRDSLQGPKSRRTATSRCSCSSGKTGLTSQACVTWPSKYPALSPSLYWTVRTTSTLSRGTTPYVSTTIQMQSFWSMPPQRQFCAVVSGC